MQENVFQKFILKEGFMNSQQKANKKYHSKLKSVILKFNPDNIEDMKIFNRISEQSNKKHYISYLVIKDTK